MTTFKGNPIKAPSRIYAGLKRNFKFVIEDYSYISSCVFGIIMDDRAGNVIKYCEDTDNPSDSAFVGYDIGEISRSDVTSTSASFSFTVEAEETSKYTEETEVIMTLLDLHNAVVFSQISFNVVTVP